MVAGEQHSVGHVQIAQMIRCVPWSVHDLQAEFRGFKDVAILGNAAGIERLILVPALRGSVSDLLRAGRHCQFRGTRRMIGMRVGDQNPGDVAAGDVLYPVDVHVEIRAWIDNADFVFAKQVGVGPRFLSLVTDSARSIDGRPAPVRPPRPAREIPSRSARLRSADTTGFDERLESIHSIDQGRHRPLAQTESSPPAM